MKPHMVCVVVAAFVCVPGTAISQNLLVNGSFETPVVTGLNTPVSAPSTYITGWDLIGGSVDLTGSNVIFGTADTGSQDLDINGTSPGTITQSFATAVGAVYLLKLPYANNPNPSFAIPDYFADVIVTGNSQLLLQHLEHKGSTATNMNWETFVEPFTADSASTTLELQSRVQGFNGIFFDSLSVVQVPEPSSLVLAAIATIGLIALARRSRFRRSAAF